MTLGGIDILILHGASLERIMAALAAVCGLTVDGSGLTGHGSGLTVNGIIGPDDDIMDRLDVLDLPLAPGSTPTWAVTSASRWTFMA